LLFSWLWLAVWCALGVVTGYYVRSHFLYGVTAAAAVVTIGLIGWGCFLAGYWVLVVLPAALYLAASMLMKAYVANLEAYERQNLMKLFSQNVSPEIAEEIWTHRDTFLRGSRPVPQELMVTVLFTDLKNYSTISEKMTRSELIDWVNECQTTLARLVSKHHGVVNCYMGDGLMAVFGVPVPRRTNAEQQQDAINAVRCGVEMRNEILRLNDIWTSHGLPRAGLRVGIYTGEAMTGMLGSDDKIAYSVIGDTVNTASRLESVDKEGAMTGFIRECRVLIGALTYEHIKDVFRAEYVGTVNLKGKAAATPFYKILD
jgi:adenylate cyclase